MHDLNEFLSDSFQYKLKEIASSGSRNRFENTLQNYFDIFFDEFNKIQSSHTVDCFKTITSSTKPSLYDWMDGAYEGLLSEINTFKDIFKDLMYSYQLFIRGKHYQATLHIFDVIEKYEMTDVINPGELGLYYKGRFIRSGDVTTNDSYYYHIPFDKRFLIGNQRFSYSGQPILYVGSSILDVLYELRCETNNAEDIAIASFGYDPLIESSINQTEDTRFEKLKIYDVTNHIHKLINEVLNNLINQGAGIPKVDDPGYRPNLNDLKKDFKKFILTQICTFKRTHSNTFIEEYIPAQILTEALRINGYNGVKFPSTQFDGKNIGNKSILHLSAVQENLALFTKYSNTEVFDMDLMKYFFVTPLERAIAKSKSLEEYRKEIANLQSDITMGCYHNVHNLNNSLIKASMNIGKVYACESDLEVDGIPYFDLDFAKLELFAQANYLKQIKHQIGYFTNGKQTMFPMK
ncbi:hypothetical protein QW060_05910 [Myroides ceti]|uniref:RES domain-containing protein n=1 Tax=Paenimyroides ceti TaxID=395087 RepID=A0ABT8CR50_9FLAO|nr:hypothetical protein [Paenimyroides ceti]MDN3706664.1 hypothetical protein [Paenimyroides ceti]